MAWNDRAVTLQGLEMLRRCLGGETLTLDHAGGGAGVAPAASLMTQNALMDQRQTFAFGGALAELETGRRVNILITSAGLAQGYTLRQVGIWAHVGDDTPALFAVIQDAEGIPIYSEAEFPDFALNFYTVLAVSSAADVTVHVDPSAMASMADMRAAVDEAVSKAAPIAKGGTPDSTTPGTAGQHYLDTDSGKEYVCLGEKDGAYQWKPASAGTSAEIAYRDTTVETALDNISELARNAAQSIITHAGSNGHITEQERTNWNGRVPATRTVNGKPLSADVMLTAADVKARPETWTPTAADVGAVPTSRKVNGKALSADITLSAADVSARPSTWTPTAADVGALASSGTAAAATKLATARTIRTNLGSTATASFDGTGNITPGVTGTLPTANGGTGGTTSAAAIYNLISALTALTSTGLATGDYLPLLDASATTGKKVTLTNLKTWLQKQNIGARIATGSYTGTGTYGASNPCSLTFDFVPRFLAITRKVNQENDSGWIVCEAGGLNTMQTNPSLNSAVTGNTVKWYHTYNAQYQLNYNLYIYYYVAIG
ncbi:MAG: hypothetical protein HFF17_06675 [Oscillospiraceae bacterium]|nr:hypothetical protein [Oscillospiraceae bacterium]